jgi:exoribonuclease-2
LLMSVSAVAQEAASVERQTNRYWGLEYLRRHTHEVWQALVLRWLREHENLALILLEDLGLELAIRLTRSASPGDRMEVKVTYADPRQDTIQFQQLLDREAQPAVS